MFYYFNVMKKITERAIIFGITPPPVNKLKKIK